MSRAPGTSPTTCGRVSDSAAVYAELPGGQHAFDLFHSARFEAVVDGMEAFAAWVLAAQARAGLRRVLQLTVRNDGIRAMRDTVARVAGSPARSFSQRVAENAAAFR